MNREKQTNISTTLMFYRLFISFTVADAHDSRKSNLFIVQIRTPADSFVVFLIYDIIDEEEHIFSFVFCAICIQKRIACQMHHMIYSIRQEANVK